MNVLHICPPHLSDVATLPWEIQKKSFLTVLFVHTSDYFRYLRRKQIATVVLRLIHSTNEFIVIWQLEGWTTVRQIKKYPHCKLF